MSFRKLGDICQEINRKENIDKTYQPFISNGKIDFRLIGELKHIKEILIKEIENDKRKLSVYSLVYRQEEFIGKNKLDILRIDIKENDDTDNIKLQFYCKNKIDIENNMGDLLIESDNVILDRIDRYPGHNKIIEMMLKTYYDKN